MPSADARFRFAEVSGLAAAGTGGFEAGVDPEWTIGSKPNGGYLLAMLGRAAVAVSAHPHIISASAYYLHAPNPGPVLIDTQVLRQGRSASQVQARMSQEDLASVEALFITSQLDASGVPYWERGLPQIPQVPYDDCPRL